MMKLFVALLATLCVLSATTSAQHILSDPPVGPFAGQGSGDVPPHVKISDYSPKWSRLDRVNGDGNLRWIRIEGCGFRTYAEAVCVWDFKFTSTRSFIMDDNTIICELPELDKSYFKTLPQNARLDIVFDGDSNERMEYVGAFRWGPQIDCLAPLSPSNGPAVGSTSVTITGEGFQDTKLENLRVFFDDMVSASASAINDNQIVASVPNSDEIHRDALVSVSWQTSDDWTERGAIECYLHAHHFFHYGPIIDEVKGCGLVRDNSNNRVTIVGHNFNDGLFSNGPRAPFDGTDRNTVLLEIKIAGDQATDEVFGSRTVYQVELNSGDVSDTEIRFTPPNPYDGADNKPSPTRTFQQTATVDIFYRQTKRWISIGQASFVYGPVLTGVTSAWHHGGQEMITIEGCGFTDPQFVQENLEVKAGGLQVCKPASIEVRQSEDRIVCEVGYQPTLCSDTSAGEYAVTVDWQPGSNDDDDFWTLTTYELQVVDAGADVHIGPAFAWPYPTTRGPVRGSTITVDGERFLFAANNSACTVQENSATGHCDPTGWTAITLNGDTGTAANLDGGRDLFDFTSLRGSTSLIGYRLRSITDNQMVIDVGTSVFGDSTQLDFTFTRNTDSNCAYDNVHTHQFGAQCEGLEAVGASWASGPINGGDTVSVHLSDYGQYSEAVVRVCQRDHELNTARVAWPAFFQGPGGANRNPCFSNATNDEGTYERYRDLSRQAGSATGWSRFDFTTGAYRTSLDRMRGRRVWGSDYDVVIFLPSAQDQISETIAPANEMREEFDSCVDWSYDDENFSRTGGASNERVTAGPDFDDETCISTVSLECGQYRFGPVVNDITPCRGPMGPAGPAITPVTVSGSDFADGWSRAIGADGALVSFGTLIGEGASLSSGSVATSTVWGEPSRTDATVSVFFNTCNMTMVPNHRVHWGPHFTPKPISWANNPSYNPVSESVKGSADLYGFYPTEEMDSLTGGQAIDLVGIGFREFCSVRTGTCTSYKARCIIDGVRSAATVSTGTGDNANPSIRCQVPYRPFGTEASVCVEFGELPCNDATDPWIDGGDEIDWSRTLCVKDQRIWYTPLITSVSPKDGHTSGKSSSNGDELITVHGEAFTVWHSATRPAEVRVGQYVAALVNAASDTDNTIAAVVPAYSAEFNTDASVHVYFEAPNAVEEDRFRHCTNNTEHWKAWSPTTYHFGPVCNFVAPRGSTTPYRSTKLRGGSDDTTDLTLVGRHFQDCRSVDQCTRDDSVPGSFSGRCEQPQFSDELQWPFEEGQGSRSCMHRRARVTMDWFLTNGGGERSFSDVQRVNDTQDSGNEDTEFDIVVPDPAEDDEGEVECGYAHFTMNFYDALVTDETQRIIECVEEGSEEPFRLNFGPRFTGFGQEFIRPQDGIAYGWSETAGSVDDHLVTITGSLFNDDYLSEFTFLPELIVGNDVVDVRESFSNTGSVSFAMPEKNWQTEFQLSARWASDSPSRTLCEEVVGRFHYGPILTSSSLDGCTSPVPLNTTGETVVVNGWAFNCCGYDAIGSPHRCWTGSQITNTLFTPTTQSPGSNTVTCRIPNNVRHPDQWLVDFGLVFGVEDDTDFCTGGDCSISASTEGQNTDSPLNKPRNTVGRNSTNAAPELNICFGPKLATDTFRVRYSGYGDVNSADDDDEDTNRKKFGWSLVGGTNTAITDDIQAAYCSYENGDEVIDADLDQIDSATVLCPARLWHAYCGQPDESLRVTFNISLNDRNNEAFLYTPKPYTIRRSGSGSPSFRSESGDDITSTVKYGPWIGEDDLDVTSSGLWDGEVEADDEDYETNMLFFWTADNEVHDRSITVTVQLSRDWHNDDGGDTNPNMWGYKKALCFFGRDTTDSPRMRRAIDYADSSQFHAVTLSDFSLNDDGSSEVTCDVPDGNMGEEGNIYVLIDPHVDDYTRLFAPSDGPAARRLGKYWHWTPYAESLSNTWSGPEGLEPVTVYGGGFCKYDRVFCRFAGSSTFDGVQADIVTDRMVVCQARPSGTPMSASVQLFFTSQQCEGFGCDGELDSAQELSYQVTGVTDAWPRHGPVHGNTPVYFEHVGLDNFDSLQCQWQVDGQTVSVALEPSSAPPSNDTEAPPAGSYQCVSPSANEVQLAQVNIVGYYNNFASSNGSAGSYMYARDLGCVWFDYGVPSIDTIEPTHIEWGRGDTVTVTGDYFNGGASNETGTFECWWQVGANPDSDYPRELGQTPTFGTSRTVTTTADKVDFVQSRNSREFNSFRLLCATPTSNLRTIGAYPFEVFFDDFRTGDNFNFDVTQRSDRALRAYQARDEAEVDGQTMPVVSEIGGVRITIEGENIGGGRLQDGEQLPGYLCRFDSSLVNDDPTLYSVGTYDRDLETVVCIAPPRNLTDFFDDDDDEPVAVAVSVSLDSGYTWTSPLDVYYSRDERAECLTDSAASTFTALVSLTFTLLFSVFFLF